MKAYRIVFCTVAIAILFSSLSCKALDKLGILPDFLDNGSFSYLEGGEIQDLPSVTFDNVASGQFQDEAESYLSGCFPARDEVLLANAAIQRGVISLANYPFGFDVYPTQFGGTKLYSVSAGAMFELPTAANKGTLEAIDQFTQSINSIALSHPEADVVLFVPDCTRVTESSPASPLVNNAITHSSLLDSIREGLDSSIDLLGYENDGTGDFLTNFFETDHHWTIAGAYKGYLDIARTLGIAPETPSETIEYSYQSYGSIARQGLYLTGTDHIVDYRFGQQEYEVLVNGEERPRDGRQSYSDGSIDPELAKYQSYESYFGGNYSLVQYINDDPSVHGSNILIIGDSFTQPVEPMIAASYENTYVIDPRERYLSVGIDEFIKDHDIDSVVVLMRFTTIIEKGVAEGLMS